MRTIAVVIILACMLVGLTAAASICPWSSSSEEMIPPVHITVAANTMGICEGVVGASHFTGVERVSEGTLGATSIASDLFSVGNTEYARQIEYGTSELGVHYESMSGVDVVGKATYQESVMSEVLTAVDGDLANSTPACIYAYDSVGGMLAQGLVGTQIGVSNYPDSMMSMQMQTGVGPSSMVSALMASGTFFTHSSMGAMIGDDAISEPVLGTGVTMQDNTYWHGKFQMVHQFSYGVTNLGSLSRNLTVGA